MRAENFDINILIETLQGTCDSLDQVLENLYPDMVQDDINKEEKWQMYNEIFLCPVCGWWCENSDASEEEKDGEQVCNDCYEEDN